MSDRGAGHRHEKQKRHGDNGEEIGHDLQDSARRRALNDPVDPAPPPRTHLPKDPSRTARLPHRQTARWGGLLPT